MESVIKLNSRDGVNSSLEQIFTTNTSDSKSYLLKTDALTSRLGNINDKDNKVHKFIDPSGGPMITEGYILEEVNAKVKYIDFVRGLGTVVTFE